MDLREQRQDRAFCNTLRKEPDSIKLRVLIIAQYFPPDMGGGATRAHNVAKGLSLVGCDVTVVTAFPHYPTGNIPMKYKRKLLRVGYEGKLRVIRTFVPSIESKGIARRILLFASFSLSALLAMPLVGEVDVVWAANPNVISVFLGSAYKIAKHCPLVQNVDDLWPEALYDLGVSRGSLLTRMAEFAARFAYRTASAITPISPAYVPVITNKYEVDQKKIHVVPAGIDLQRFSSTVDAKSARSGRKYVVLYIGALSPAYNFDQVFEAAKLLVAYPDIKIIIRGGGELSADLKLKVKAMKMANVEILDKIVDRKEVARIMSEADALLLPLSGASSIEMGLSSKLYEYQAAGKPIVCCSSGQPGSYVAETRSGVVISPGDYRGLAKALLYLRKNPKIASRLGRSGRRYVTANVQVDSIGIRMGKILRAVHAARRRRK